MITHTHTHHCVRTYICIHVISTQCNTNLIVHYAVNTHTSIYTHEYHKTFNFMMNHYSHNFVRAATSRPGTEGDRQLKRMTMMLILQLKIPQCLLLLQWLLLNTPLPTWADEQPCPPAVKIDNYFDLEEIAINNSSVNREELFRVFFSPNLPSPKSVKVYYYYQVDNCSEPQPYRIAEGSCGNNETWYWMSSAVYFIIDPLVLDRHALHILSWLPPFPEQLQPELKLTIPPIAANKAFNLLQQFTMTVSNMHAACIRLYSMYSITKKAMLLCVHDFRWGMPASLLFTAQGVCYWKQSEKRLGLCEAALQRPNTINHEE